jgi:hypothetical protein
VLASRIRGVTLSAIFLAGSCCLAAKVDAAQDLANILAFPVPDALNLENGLHFQNVQVWNAKRRPEILNAFAEHVYGHTPSEKLRQYFQVDSVDRSALSGEAIRKQITIAFSPQEDSPRIHLLVYEPVHAKYPFPAIVGLNFEGNQTVDSDPGITLHDVWVPDPEDRQTINELRRHERRRPSEDSRGRYAYRWQLDKVLQRGYALATAYYGDIEPDFDGGLRYGVRSLFLRPVEQWGAIGAWAWGLSRALDYLVTDPAIDAKRVVVIGHSRLGKAAAWAAAQDQRFAVLLSNESGMGGVSLYRAKTGETLEHLNTSFPYWFCEKFHQYTGHPERLPVDGNLLLSLCAPRPAYIASAEQDSFSNPSAEFLSAVLAGNVYRLFGKPGLGTNVMPPVDQAVMRTLGYHVRRGVHEVTEFDWDQYLKFLDLQFGR